MPTLNFALIFFILDNRSFFFVTYYDTSFNVILTSLDHDLVSMLKEWPNESHITSYRNIRISIQ